MRLIDEQDNIKYYEGFDVEKIKNHPPDGSNGMMVVFFESLENEQKKYNRKQKLSNLLNNTIYNDFNKLIDGLSNNYLMINETKGYHDIIYRSVKSKLETTPSLLPWNLKW